MFNSFTDSDAWKIFRIVVAGASVAIALVGLANQIAEYVEERKQN